MKSSPVWRLLIAAGLYLLIMWGYLSLPTPQLFAVFAALIMSIALLLWVAEARAMAYSIQHGRVEARHLSELCNDEQPQWQAVENLSEPPLSAAVSRLDALKSELAEQYAQFGRDQSLINSKGLGTWHNAARKSGGDQ